MRANTNSGAAAVQGITVSPNGLSLTGDYVVKATIWANSYGGWTDGATLSGSNGTRKKTGSTETSSFLGLALNYPNSF
jgi:hypothetical protein